MKIAVTSPFAHPYVRRGAERYLHDLATYLAGRDHDVTIVTTAPDASRDERQDGVLVRYRRQGRALGRGRFAVDPLLRTGPTIGRAVRELDADLLQCNHPSDAMWTRLLWRGRPPLVVWLPGVPKRHRVREHPLHGLVFRMGTAGAARVLTLSRFAADRLRAEFGMDSAVVPPGVWVDRFAGPKPAPTDPVVFCPAAADDFRKKVGFLVRTFPLVLRHRPDARLVLAPPRTEPAREMVSRLEEPARARVDVLEVSDEARLAELYRAAAVTVLPSVDEAFGLVLTESLAAGTPVVGSDAGAIPDVVHDDSIGRLFPVGDGDALAKALVDVMDLALDEGTVERCRAAARRWDWSVVGAQHESVYASVLADGAATG